MNQIKYGILHWGPCVVKTKVDQNTQDLLLSEGAASKEDASPELAGVLKNQFHYRDKNKFQKFMEGSFNLYNAAMQKWKQGNKKISRRDGSKEPSVSMDKRYHYQMGNEEST